MTFVTFGVPFGDFCYLLVTFDTFDDQRGLGSGLRIGLRIGIKIGDLGLG